MIHEETLYRKRITKTNITIQLYLPQNLISEVLAKYHDHIMTGHLGQNRTLDKITKRYYWPYMENDIKNHIRSCTSCQMRKRYLINLQDLGSTLKQITLLIKSESNY